MQAVKPKKRPGTWMMGDAVIVAMTSTSEMPAWADETTAAFEAVVAADPLAMTRAAEMIEMRDGTPVARVGSGTVALPYDASEGVSMNVDGLEVTIDLASSRTAPAKLISEAAAAVYDNHDDSSTVAVANEDSSASIYAVIETASAPTRYSYEYSGGVQLSRYDDGGVGIFSTGTGEIVGLVAQPWAKDANGAKVPTYYELTNNTLTQVVVHTDESAYPVVAQRAMLGSNNMYAKILQNGSSLGTIISVHPAAVKFTMYTNDQIFNAYKAIVPAAYEGQKYRDQLLCHVWNVGQLKVPWNLDSWRPNVGYPATVAAPCNP